MYRTPTKMCHVKAVKKCFNKDCGYKPDQTRRPKTT
ncbi:hypothetical protein XENTR_v10006407 [Xenopus tropicalis]|nr:hypothetical protein XENTR_v10006407 [Xenopus tropicalis]